MWPMYMGFAVIIAAWLLISVALVVVLVAVLRLPIAAAAGLGLGLAAAGIVFNGQLWIARRAKAPGRPPAEVAADEFLGGRRD